jgi:hypothetical protein
MGVDASQARSQVMAELQQPGGLERAIQRSTASVAELGNIMGQRVNAIEAQRQAQADRAAAARQQAIIQGIITGEGAPAGANALATGGTAPTAPVNALAAPPSAPAGASIMTPEATAAAPVAPAAAPTMGEVTAEPLSEADVMLSRIGQLREAAALGVAGASAAADQLQKQYDLLTKREGGLSPSERFVPVGKNVFDRQTQQWSQPPTEEDVNELKPQLQKGERWNEEAGRVDAVPGSKLYIEQNRNHGKDLQTVRGANTKGLDAVAKINEILSPENASAFAGNFGGYNAYATRMLPGENSDLRKKIDSLKSNMKGIGLELMRSGGSIGTMTEKEWPIVEQMLGSIDPVLGEDNARLVLQQISDRVRRIVDDANAIYDSNWMETQYYKPESTGRVGEAQAATGAQGMSAADRQAAEQWLKDNPNDPRAPEIKSRLRM